MKRYAKKGLQRNPFFNEDGSINWQTVKIDDAESMVQVFQEDQNCAGFDLIEGILSKVNAFEHLAAEVDYDSEALQKLRSKKRREMALTLGEEIHDFFMRVKIIATPGFPGPAGWSYGFTSRPDSSTPDFKLQCWGEFLYFAMMDGYAWAIRRCGKCRNWFRARRRDQKFCSDKCRERQLRGTSEGKGKRAEYMRRYRAGLKRRDSENLKTSQSKRR